MNKNSVVYLLGDENKWGHVLGQINNLQKRPDVIENISVVVIDTAVLSCLKNIADKDLQVHIDELSKMNVSFFLCNNTLIKYGIPRDLIYSAFTIVEEGGIIKTVTLEDNGSHLIPFI